MNSVKRRWQRLAQRIDATSPRERVMIFVAIAAVFLLLVNMLLLDPLAQRNKMLQQLTRQNQEKTAVMQSQILALQTRFNIDPDAELRARLAMLHQQSDSTGKTLNEIQSGLVPPQRMTALLEDILRRNRSLHLVSLKTLPMTSLLDSEPVAVSKTPAVAGKDAVVQKPAAAASVVYKHGVELTVSGSYGDLVRYLTELEGLQWHMFWGKAELAVEQYPKVNLTLRLYTLSLDPAWLAL